jgi:small subunit ribosomal protein S16
MVKIRLSRRGAKKRPFYQIVVTDSRSRRDGRNIEEIGYFNPLAAGQDVRLHLDEGRAKYWISTGAQVSERVSRLLKDFEKNQQETSAAAA